jgi:DNA-binding CsgD family transcriptional regulator
LDDSSLTSERPLLAGTLAAFSLMAGLSAFDLASDLREGTTLTHVVAEGLILAIAIVGVVLVVRKLVTTARAARAASAEAHTLAGELAQTAAEAERWRQEARNLMRGLGEAIDEQFDRWQLSPAEKETALLLLKGLSHKEIAAARDVTEATARQQARAVYKKGGLSGRHDLAAFFLEDLMLPGAVRG